MSENFRYVTEALLLSRGCPPDRLGAAWLALGEGKPIPDSVDEVVAVVDSAIRKATVSDARDLDGLPWLKVRGLDICICGDHAEWSHDDDPAHRPCESCGLFPPDELLYAGNCPRCWSVWARP